MANPARGFPPPWSVDELEACFVVKDGRRANFGLLLAALFSFVSFSVVARY
jgi:hypothetical protein